MNFDKKHQENTLGLQCFTLRVSNLYLKNICDGNICFCALLIQLHVVSCSVFLNRLVPKALNLSARLEVSVLCSIVSSMVGEI